MSTQDPIGSTDTSQRPKNPTHFGGEGLYEQHAETQDAGDDSSLKVPVSEHIDIETQQSLQGEQSEQTEESPLWDFAKRNHVPTVLAVGGIALLLVALVRRATSTRV